MLPLPHIAVTKITFNESIHGTNEEPICFLLTTFRRPLEMFDLPLNTRELPNLIQKDREQHLVWDHGLVDLRNDLAPLSHENVWVAMIEFKLLKVFVVRIKRNIVRSAEIIQE